MNRRNAALVAAALAAAVPATLMAGLVDRNVAVSTTGDGIAMTWEQQIGAGRGDLLTPNSSTYLIQRDPFRAIRRGRQLFQRKFNRVQGQGPLFHDGVGNIDVDLALGAGLSDSCAACHGRPAGSAGFGGDVVTRPDGRDAPHLFGLGLKEMLADEITADLRAARDRALAQAQASGRPVQATLRSKGVEYGAIVARPDGSVDASRVEGVDSDLRVRPFFAHGGTVSIREFIVGACNAEMGLNAVDPDLMDASAGGRIVTPAGMVLDGATDRIEAPRATSPAHDPDGDGVVNEIPTSIVDYMEFYLLNYFKPGTYDVTHDAEHGRRLMADAGCTSCHVPDMKVEKDRRVADVETSYDPERGIFNGLFAVAEPRFETFDDGTGHPPLKRPALSSFLVKDIFTDFKRHDLGPAFHERNYDGTTRTAFLTTALWGVGSTSPYGHDGRSMNLREVILRHGGEAQASRDRFARMPDAQQADIVAFLESLVLFPPDSTASNLDPGDPDAPGFPQRGHGSVKLSTLYCEPAIPE